MDFTLYDLFLKFLFRPKNALPFPLLLY